MVQRKKEGIFLQVNGAEECLLEKGSYNWDVSMKRKWEQLEDGQKRS